MSLIKYYILSMVDQNRLITKNTSANEEFIMLSIGERKISNVERTVLFFCCWTQLNVLKTITQTYIFEDYTKTV